MQSYELFSLVGEGLGAFAGAFAALALARLLLTPSAPGEGGHLTSLRRAAVRLHLPQRR